MLDFEDAKQMVRKCWLSAFDDEPGGPQVIHDSKCVEYEWGWQIEWGPSRPERMPAEKTRQYRLPILVDRITGNLQTVSTAGTRIAIMKLLDRRPAESSSPDLSMKNLSGLQRLKCSMRAFIPLSELEGTNSKESESLEMFRLADRDQ